MKTVGFCCISIWIFSQWHILFACYHTPKKQGNQWIYTRCHPVSFLFSTTCVIFWVRHHVPSLLLPRVVAGAYTVARDAVLVEKIKWKLTRWLLAVTGWGVWKKKMWVSPQVVKISVSIDESLWRVPRRKWMWADRGRGIWHICLKLIPIRFCRNSRGALSLAFGQFMIAYTPHLGQKQNQKTIWKSIMLQQPVKLGGHPSNSWLVAALVFRSTSACILPGYSPYNLVTGDAYRIRDKMHNAQPS